MKKIFKKKLQRLLVSKNMMKILFGFHFLTGGYKSKKIDLSFKNKKNRLEIVQNILNLKKYRSYLEIGTFKKDFWKEFNYKTEHNLSEKLTLKRGEDNCEIQILMSKNYILKTLETCSKSGFEIIQALPSSSRQVAQAAQPRRRQLPIRLMRNRRRSLWM